MEHSASRINTQCLTFLSGHHEYSYGGCSTSCSLFVCATAVAAAVPEAEHQVAALSKSHCFSLSFDADLSANGCAPDHRNG
jgi:hypothetical protein